MRRRLVAVLASAVVVVASVRSQPAAPAKVDPVTLPPMPPAPSLHRIRPRARAARIRAQRYREHLMAVHERRRRRLRAFVSHIAYSTNAVDRLIASVFLPAEAGTAQCIADHESGDRPAAHNPSGAAGVFQLMPMWWDGSTPGFPRIDPYDAAANIQAAHELYLRDSWRPWTTAADCGAA